MISPLASPKKAVIFAVCVIGLGALAAEMIGANVPQSVSGENVTPIAAAEPTSTEPAPRQTSLAVATAPANDFGDAGWGEDATAEASLSPNPSRNSGQQRSAPAPGGGVADRRPIPDPTPEIVR